MKHVLTLAAVALVATTPAAAQWPGDQRDRGGYSGSPRELTLPPDADRDRRGDRRDRDDRGDDRRGDGRRAYDDDRRGDRSARGRDDPRRYRDYDYDRPDPRYGDYRPERYYRPGSHAARPLGRSDRIYRGGDGRYYCRRDDGTTGLVVGALSGGVLGNAISPGGSKTLGTVLGGGLGALLGRSIDRGGASCR